MSTQRKDTSTNYFNQGVLREACPVNDTLERLSPRWKMQVLFCINQGHNRFSLLKDLFPSLSDQVLGRRLRELETEGLVLKRPDATQVPPQVWYFTTHKGSALLKIMNALHQWEQQFGDADESAPGVG